MKKNYFMLVCLMLVMAFQAKAQVTSVADLFGEYKFTADVEFASEDYKQSYGSILLGESDVTIGADAQYAGKITGFAGSQQKLNIYKIDGNTIEMTNFNNPQLWTNLFMANANGDHPNGVNEGGEWISYPYNTEYYEYNPETKVITVPTFTVVTVSGTNVTVIATYKNAKLTYVGGSETDKPETPAFDWAGTYTFSGTPGAVDENAEYPSTFEVVVEFMEATEYTDAMYVVTSFMGNDLSLINYEGGIKLTIASDGKSATLANGCVQSLGGGNFLKLFDMNATANPIAITLNDDGTLSMADFSIVSSAYESNTGTTVAWYQNVTLSKDGAGVDTSAFTWVGQHSVKVGSIESYNGKSYPKEFTMTVVEGDKSLLVTEFFSTDVVELNYGGIAFTVAADGKSAEIPSASFVGGAYPDYLVIYDMNAGESPIRFVLNEDGSVTIDNFCINSYNFETYEESLAALFKDVTIPAAGGEVVEPEEPETPAFDWVGTYTFSGTPGEGSGELPSTFEVVVEFVEADVENGQEAMYVVTNFMGRDIVGINYGGIELTIADDGKSATLANGNVQSYGGGNFLKLFDGNGTANPIAITLNDDGTLSMADFSLVSGAWGDNENNTFVGWYQNVTLTKGGEAVEPEEPEVAEKRYRVKCDNGYLNVYSTYAYPTGPIGGVNVVEKADDNSQIFTMEDAGNGAVYLKSVSGYYLYCQSWNVDGNAAEKSALTFEDAGNDKFYIKCVNGYFKVEYVSETPVATINGTQVDQPAISGYFPYCDAPVGAAVLWTLEEVADETGIEDVVVEPVAEGVYDMQGRKIDAVVAPGLYIINGKKILVK